MWILSGRLENARMIHEGLLDKLKVVTESTLSAEERAARLDQLLQEEEAVQTEIETELKRLRDMQFRKTEELHEARTEQRNTEAEIGVCIFSHD